MGVNSIFVKQFFGKNVNRKTFIIRNTVVLRLTLWNLLISHNYLWFIIFQNGLKINIILNFTWKSSLNARLDVFAALRPVVLGDHFATLARAHELRAQPVGQRPRAGTRP
jgi:hypothetical protein